MRRLPLTVVSLALSLLSMGLRAEDKEPPSYDALVLRGINALGVDSLTEAEDCFRSAMKLRPSAGSNYLLFRYLGQIEERRGKDAEALECYRTALAMHPSSPELLLDRAALYYRRGEEERALMDYTSALELDPQNTEALLLRAYLYRRKREYSLSRHDYETLLSLDPANLNAMVGLILLNDESSRPREAMEQVNALIQLYPSHALLYAVRGGMEQRRKQYEPALHDLTTAIELDPTNVDYYVSRVSLYLDMGKKKLARQDARIAVTLGADPVEMASMR